MKTNTVKRCVSEALKKRVAASQQWRCKACDILLSANFDVDHIVALHNGGSNEVENLQALCLNCHRDKTFEDSQRKLQQRREAANRDVSRSHFLHFCEAKPHAVVPFAVVNALVKNKFGVDLNLSHLDLQCVDMKFPQSLWQHFFDRANISVCDGIGVLHFSLKPLPPVVAETIPRKLSPYLFREYTHVSNRG